MTPRAIVHTALAQNLDLIAICDHNSARNVAATQRAASESRLTVIPGIEVTTSEEVHLVGLFETSPAAELMQDEVYARLFGANDEEVFGYQVVVDEEDLVHDLDQRLLIGATTLPTERVVSLIHGLGGLAIAAHVDRSGFGIFSQLGFIPANLKLDALEVSARSSFKEVRNKYRQCKDFPMITSSDAHYLKDIGKVTTVALLAEPSFKELKKAIANQEGRRIIENDETNKLEA
jgi:PHP family Zn ribbon phosphoesterase